MRVAVSAGAISSRLSGSEAGSDPETPGRKFDVVLADIADHSPAALLDAGNGSFYRPDGLRRLTAHLRPGGVFGLWSDDRPDAAFTERLAGVPGAASGGTGDLPQSPSGPAIHADGLHCAIGKRGGTMIDADLDLAVLRASLVARLEDLRAASGDVVREPPARGTRSDLGRPGVAHGRHAGAGHGAGDGTAAPRRGTADRGRHRPDRRRRVWLLHRLRRGNVRQNASR